MLDVSLFIIGCIFILWAYILILHFNLHMFQLNGYKKNEHLKWLLKNENARKQFILIILLMLYANIGIWKVDGLIKIIPYVLLLFLLVCTIVIYHKYKVSGIKKKLVYTARVKRLIITNIVLNSILVALGFLIPIYHIPMIGVILTCIQPFVLLLSAIINTPIEKGVNNYYINDAKKILKVREDLEIIGITGSYGKTSMKFFLQTLLSAKYNVCVTPESYNTPMGVVKTIRGVLKRTDEIFLCEMGARHVGDIKELCDIVHPHHGIITSVGPQHLETFFSIENIKNTKFELADSLPKGGKLFLGADSEYIMEKTSEGRYPGAIFYGVKDGSDVRAELISVSGSGTEFKIHLKDGATEVFTMKLLGEHNLANVCGAIAVAHDFGIELKDLKVPVRRLEPVAHRMQIISHGAYTIIDDAFNSNPVGSKAAVETLGLFKGVRILITPGMVELGSQEEALNETFGRYAADNCDYIILVGKRRTKPIARGAINNGFDKEKLFAFEEFGQAMDFAAQLKSDEHKYILLENDLPDNY